MGGGGLFLFARLVYLPIQPDIFFSIKSLRLEAKTSLSVLGEYEGSAKALSQGRTEKRAESGRCISVLTQGIVNPLITPVLQPPPSPKFLGEVFSVS